MNGRTKTEKILMTREYATSVTERNTSHETVVKQLKNLTLNDDVMITESHSYERSN